MTEQTHSDISYIYSPWYVDIKLCVSYTHPPSTSSKNNFSEDHYKGHHHSPKRQKTGHSDSNGGHRYSDMAMGRPGHHSEAQSEVRGPSNGWHNEIPRLPSSPSDMGINMSCGLRLPSSPPPSDIEAVKLTKLGVEQLHTLLRSSPGHTGDTGDRDRKFSDSSGSSTSTSLVDSPKVGNLNECSYLY